MKTHANEVGLALNQPLIRLHVEREIERLIALLDAMDGDCDLEDGADDEPSIGSDPRVSVMGELEIDLELDDEREEDHAEMGVCFPDQYDDEPASRCRVFASS